MRVFLGLLLALAPLFGDGISHDEYRTRRADLRKSLDGVMVLFGATESDDLRIPYLQETNFLYLSGVERTRRGDDAHQGEEILFLPERSRSNRNLLRSPSRRGDPDAHRTAGFDKVMSNPRSNPSYPGCWQLHITFTLFGGDPSAKN